VKTTEHPLKDRFMSIALLTFLTVCILGVVFIYRNKSSEQKVLDLAFSDKALSLFDESLKGLTERNIQAKQAQLDNALLKLQKEKLQLQADIDAMPFWMSVKQWTILISLSLVGIGLIVSGVFAGRVIVWRNSLVSLKAGDIETQIARKAVNDPQYVMFVHTIAQIRNTHSELSIKEQLELAAMMIRAVGGHRGLGSQAIDITPELMNNAPAIQTSHAVPTFADLLQDGSVGPGRPFVFGIQEGQHVSGTEQDIFACAIGAESGGGKTTTLRGFICQAALRGGKSYVIDFNFPHTESLLFSTKPLEKQGAVVSGNPKKIIEKINTIIDRRMRREEPSHPPVFFIVDEALEACKRLPFLLLDLIFKVSTEGRKTGVFGIFAGHSWGAKRTGGDSALTSNCESKLVHRMSRVQANILLDDADLAKQAKYFPPGRAFFKKVGQQPVILDVPFCTLSDVERVAGMLPSVSSWKPTQSQGVSAGFRSEQKPNRNQEETRAETTQDFEQETNAETGHQETAETTKETNRNQDRELLQKVQGFCDRMTLPKVAKMAGVNRGYLSRVLRGEKMSENLRQKLVSFVQSNA
jgi:hypothetical protein